MAGTWGRVRQQLNCVTRINMLAKKNTNSKNLQNTGCCPDIFCTHTALEKLFIHSCHNTSHTLSLEKLFIHSCHNTSHTMSLENLFIHSCHKIHTHHRSKYLHVASVMLYPVPFDNGCLISTISIKLQHTLTGVGRRAQVQGTHINVHQSAHFIERKVVVIVWLICHAKTLIKKTG